MERRRGRDSTHVISGCALDSAKPTMTIDSVSRAAEALGVRLEMKVVPSRTPSARRRSPSAKQRGTYCAPPLTGRVEVETHLLGVLLVAVLGQEHIGQGLGGPVLPESLHLWRVGDGVESLPLLSRARPR